MGVVAIFVIVIIHNVLAETVGQHPEDANDPAVLAAEQELLDDYGRRNGPEALQAFQKVWGKNSLSARSMYVPWAFLKSRDREVQERIAYLQTSFRRAEERQNMFRDLAR